MGWFFGLKLHLLLPHQGRIMALKIRGGTTDARQPLEPMGAPGWGKVVADKGASSKFPMKRLWQGGLPLPTGMGRTMKTPCPLLDKLLVRKLQKCNLL